MTIPALCSDCPPVGYPTDRTRCDACPRRIPSLDEQVAQLKAAGWKRINRSMWKAPVGGYFLGPHGAWKAMKRRAGA